METLSLNHLLSSVHTFEEFEQLKHNLELFEAVAMEIIAQHHLPKKELALFSEGTNIVFAYGSEEVIKIFPPFHRDQFHSELLVLKHLHGKLSIKTPAVLHDGSYDGWPYIIMTQLDGTLLETLWETMEHHNKVIIIRELGALIKEVHSLSTDGLEAIDCHWNQFIEQQIVNALKQHEETGLATNLLEQVPAYLNQIKDLLPQIKKPVILTGEYTPMNFLVKQVDGVWHINGLIDFGDSMLGLPEYDLLGPGAFLIQGDKQLLHAFLTSYGYLPEMLTDTLSYQLTALMLLHKYSNLNVQVRVENWKNKVANLKDLQDLVWGFPVGS